MDHIAPLGVINPINTDSLFATVESVALKIGKLKCLTSESVSTWRGETKCCFCCSLYVVGLLSFFCFAFLGGVGL